MKNTEILMIFLLRSVMCEEDNAGIWVIFCGPLCILSLSLAISFFLLFSYLKQPATHLIF